MGWIRVPTTAYFSRQKISLAQVNVKEAGFVFACPPYPRFLSGRRRVYLSYEDQSNNFVYFDEFKITHTKSNLIQGNEYYPFGMQTANSWTRDNATANNYLANGGTELNPTSQLYDLYYRNFDPALGRMFQVDPMASKYGSLTPYNYSLNNPTNLNDPLGDDVEPQPPIPREYQCAQCWREGNNESFYMRIAGGGSNSLGYGWRPGTSGISMGSGNHWADGMQYSDWSSYGGSQLFRDGLSMGYTNLGGRLYDYSGAEKREVKEGPDGRLGHWERRSRYDLEGYDGKPGMMPATEIWDVFVVSDKKKSEQAIRPRNFVVDAIHRGQNAFADDPYGAAILGLPTYAMGGAFAAVGRLLKLVNVVKASSLGVNRIYSAKALIRRAAEPGPFHNFPESFNQLIFSGSKTVTANYYKVAKPGLSNTNILYQMPGNINGHSGVFEIAVRPSLSGNTEVIMHRFFRPY